jgi:hypothetical protein
MQRQAAKEDGEHKNPLEVLEERGEEGVGSEAVAEDGEGDVAQTCEDDHEGEPAIVNTNLIFWGRKGGLPDSPAVDIVLVEIAVIPTNCHVVRCCHDPRRADGVVCSNVRNNGDLTSEADVREQKLAEKRCEGTSHEPEPEWVEQQLVAAVRILFPTSKLIVDCERDAFLEAVTGPGCKTDNIAIYLEA